MANADEAFITLESYAPRHRKYNRFTRRFEPIPIPPSCERVVRAPLGAPPGAEDEFPSREEWLSLFEYDNIKRVTQIPPQWRQGIFYPGRDCTVAQNPNWEKMQREDVERQQEALDFLEYGDFMAELDIRPLHEESIRKVLDGLYEFRFERLKTHPANDPKTMAMYLGMTEFVVRLTMLQATMQNQVVNEQADALEWRDFTQRAMQLMQYLFDDQKKFDGLGKTQAQYMEESRKEYEANRAEEYKKFMGIA